MFMRVGEHHWHVEVRGRGVGCSLGTDSPAQPGLSCTVIHSPKGASETEGTHLLKVGVLTGGVVS